MKDLEWFHEQCIQIGSEAKNKEGVLKEIAALVAGCADMAPYTEDDIFNALKEREEIGSTGFQNGVAIPHCSLEKLSHFIVGILVIPEGVDFQALDGKPTQVFFFIVGPAVERNKHIQILSSISKVMKIPSAVTDIRTARSPQELRDRFAMHVKYEESLALKKHTCQFTVLVQKEEFFEDILEILSSQTEGNIVIVESTNAGHYLHKMPLFAAFWTEETRRYSRIILAVVPKDLMNDTLRRINMVVNTQGAEAGVLITVQDLLYSTGAIEF